MADILELTDAITGSETGLQRAFLVENANDEDDALTVVRAYLTANLQLSWPPLPPAPPTPAPGDVWRQSENRHWYLHNLAIAEIEQFQRGAANSKFRVTANYGFRATCPIVEWETVTDQVRVTQSISTVFHLPTGKTAGDETDTLNAIEWDPQKGYDVRGTDVLTPTHRLNVLWHPPSGFVTQAWEDVVRSMVTTVNEKPMFGVDALELLLVDFQKTLIDQRNELYEIRLLFNYGKNQDAPETIGGIDIPYDPIGDPGSEDLAQKGHTYTWLLRNLEPDANNKGTFPKASQLMIEELYEQSDFWKIFTKDGDLTTNRPESEGCPYFGYDDFQPPP